MSSVKIHVPPNKLGKLLRVPGGMAVADAVQKAGAGLEGLKADLLDYLKGQQRWDPNAVLVHLRAFRLLLHTEGAKDTAGAQAILEGLKKVSQRYAKPTSEG